MRSNEEEKSVAETCPNFSIPNSHALVPILIYFNLNFDLVTSSHPSHNLCSRLAGNN